MSESGSTSVWSSSRKYQDGFYLFMRSNLDGTSAYKSSARANYWKVDVTDLPVGVEWEVAVSRIDTPGSPASASGAYKLAHLCCDFIHGAQLVKNSTYAPRVAAKGLDIMKVFRTDTTHDTHTPNPRTYHPLRKSSLKGVLIFCITDFTGAVFQFNAGWTTLELHFRKKQYI